MAVRQGTYAHTVAGRDCLTSFYKDVAYEEWLEYLICDWRNYGVVLNDSPGEDSYIVAEIPGSPRWESIGCFYITRTDKEHWMSRPVG